jgi:HD-like signal output (HDOD) protein
MQPHSVRRLAQIDFNIPGIKNVGMELMKLMNAPEPDMDAIARTIELDPALFGSVLACANSPLFCGISEIIDLRVAINRLGLKEIRRIVFHVVLESAFRSDNTHINKLLRSIWSQNLSVSLTMQRLASEMPQVGTLPMDMVTLIYPLGLMHVIGIPVLIINKYEAFARFVAEDLRRPLPDIFAREKEVFDGFDHFELGSELVKRWAFPDFVPEVIACYNQPEPALDDDTRVLHTLLRQARHLTEQWGYSALPGAPEGFWLEGNVFDLAEADLEAMETDVREQLSRVEIMFS